MNTNRKLSRRQILRRREQRKETLKLIGLWLLIVFVGFPFATVFGLMLGSAYAIH